MCTTIITSASDYSVRVLFGTEQAAVTYVVPPYQREYAWGKEHYQQLLDDLEENSLGYFLGSIICVNSGGDALAPRLELVDGQQRMTTLSLMLAAAYAVVQGSYDPSNSDQTADIVALKRNLALNSKHDKIRLVPQIQGNNKGDYLAVLAKAGIINPYPPPPNAGNRKIFRAFRRFQKHIKEEIQGDLSGGDAFCAIMDFLAKIYNASMVKIEVGNHSSAYTLFEALNNRGKPLTAIDIIKNKLLARFERDNPNSLESNFQRWNQILKHLGGDDNNEQNQERFLRQYYNAFRFLLNQGGPEAKRSNIIALYEKLINSDPEQFLADLAEAGRDYGLLLQTHEDDDRLSKNLRKRLSKLDRIEGVPSYVLLLFLLMRGEELHLTDRHFADVLDFLVCFFVRRNLTDKPPTRDLTRLFMKINEEKLANGVTGDEVVAVIKTELRAVSASDEIFRSALSGQIYDENVGVTRFILCELCGEDKERELWKRQGKDYAWSIEHVFPQGKDIPNSWVEMMADGDQNKAQKIQQSHVHTLGNLTLSGYNSNLGNKSFKEKRDAKEGGQPKGKDIGYRNGLKINSFLVNQEDWSADAIDKRTRILVEDAMDLFNLGHSQ